ncbi:BolA family transcriptional regulator [bacterium]|nr:BolA family transcriptional regulator [bacterium]
MTSLDDIRQLLIQALAPKTLHVEDESHRHAGHYIAASSDPSHIRIRIVSNQFSGLSKVKQHQLVNRILKPAFDEGLHALALETLWP